MPIATIACPHCTHRMSGPPARCPRCRGDLGPLARLAAFADWHYNEALRLYRTREWVRAAESIGVTLALNPGDTEAKALRRKIRAKLNRRR
ncbi:hypothetical protein [Actinomadura chokoriensis]|uniref:Zinc ribbon domain-containing protein n=1 Tax=Actinomadura chokoriensis TaxID=454156 RepID=A0ABV4R4W8_9ACTN